MTLFTSFGRNLLSFEVVIQTLACVVFAIEVYFKFKNVISFFFALFKGLISFTKKLFFIYLEKYS